MNESFIKLALPPGIVKRGTVYETAGRWRDGNLVRFTEGRIQPVGGRRRVTDANGSNLAALSGIPRALLASSLDDGSPILAAGTTSKFYVVAGGTVNDVTPAGFTAGDADGGFSGGGGTYGHSVYGSGLYGTGVTAASFTDATTWQLDSFGQSVAAVDTKNKKLYLWAGNVAVVAAVPAGAPASAVGVVCTPERFLFALGAGGISRKVQWPSQETSTDWTPTAVNTAGDFELSTNGRLMAGRRAKAETILWTDADCWAARYIGGPLIYQFIQVGDNCGLIAPNAGCIVDSQAFWMGQRGFFGYDGYVKPLPSEVSDYVFSDMNGLQAAKIWAMPVPEFGEVWWFYPSSMSTEIDRYVSYSYREGHWSVGQMARTAGTPSGAIALPIMAAADGILWEHEVGEDRGSDVPYVESGPIELGNGDQVARVVRLVPDEKTLGDVEATFYTSFYPATSEATQGPYPLAAPTDVRFTARQTRVRFAESRQTAWRVGVPRLGVLPGGRR